MQSTSHDKHQSLTIESYSLNNFNLLRFIAASLVVYTHCYGLTGKLPIQGQDHFAYLIYLLGNVGVDIFFVISGFLVTKSYQTRNSLVIFARARALRIYPGLLCSLCFTVIIIGPLNTSLSLADYFDSPQLKIYFLSNLSLVKTVLELPGVFADNVYRFNANGSLWTLPAEARMYVLIAGLGASGILFKNRLYLLTLTLGIVLYLVDKNKIPLISNNSLYFKLSWFFFSGSLYYIFRESILLNKYLCAISITILLLSCYVFPEYRHWIYGLCLPYATLWFAFNIKALNVFNQIGDYSYGIYIYAFPIQQSIIKTWPDINLILLFYLSMILTLTIAIPSWHFIEKPALRFKTRNVD